MSSSPKRVLITGCTGQDGSYMADYLLAQTDHLVYGMVRRTAKPDYGNIAAAMSNPRFQFVTGDLSDTTSIDNVVRQVKPDYFINLGAQSFVGSSWQIPEQTFDVGAVGVLRCLEAIRKHVPQCRFYNAGSSEELGRVEYSPQDERHPMRPQSPYGAAKCAARHIVRVYRESYGLYAVQGTLFNHESPRRGPEFVTRKITLGVARIANAIRNDQPFEPIELGNLDAKRDWSHAEDFVDGIWRMLNQVEFNCRHLRAQGILVDYEPNPVPGEYVLASGETHSIREFVEKAFATTGVKGDWIGEGIEETYRFVCATVRNGEWIERPENLMNHDIPLVRINPAFYRPAEVDLLLGDSTRARTELGWQPKVSFDELVRRMVESDMAAYEQQPMKLAA